MNGTTIRVGRETARRLGRLGGFHDTYDSVLNLLCEHAETCSLLKKGTDRHD
ncbi:MAG: hypothetical protein HKP31_08785 [Nitrosopumilus sp.]|nr:hypothetical protein [Nitrosopumilus sp.]